MADFPNFLTDNVRQLYNKLVSLLPAACVMCRRHCSGQLCTACEEAFSGQAVRCPQCGTRQEHATTCLRCAMTLPAYDQTIVACDYTGIVSKLILRLKFHADFVSSHAFAHLLRNHLCAQHAFPLPDLLIPVPLANKRLSGRGYNQALEITRPLSRMLGIPLHAKLACRQKETHTQSLLSGEARHSNIAQAFTVAGKHAHLLEDRHIGIIDDVMTTGATLNALATTLKDHGARKVTCLVAARPPY